MSSVRKKDQSPHRFTVLDTALDVYDYTTTVIANPKIFDRTYKDLIDRMDREASLIYHYCRAANDDYDNRIKEEAEIRLQLEAQAIEQCLWLKTDIRLAQRKFHLRAKKACYWTDLVNKALAAIRSWRGAEKRFYEDNYGL